METRLPHDFKEFLALLNSARIEYLLVGGYAVSYHGYPRPTGDLDVWVAADAGNAQKLVNVLSNFGFSSTTPDVFLAPGQVVRMGVPPVRIEIINKVSGLEFSESFARRIDATLDGMPVFLICLADLLANKRAAGRPKDLNDISQLEGRKES